MIYIQHIFERLESILHTVQGWFVCLGVLFLDYIAGHEFAVGLVVGVTLMDAAWGIAVSIKQGKFALSELARLTIAKFGVYGCALLAFIGIDKVVSTELIASTVATGITLVELWSAMGNMLIIYPEMPALKLLKKALTGEIASKLHIEPEEVDTVLKDLERRAEQRKRQSEGVTDEQIHSARRRAYKKKEEK